VPWLSGTAINVTFEPDCAQKLASETVPLSEL
jgi:hypothetical protein